MPDEPISLETRGIDVWYDPSSGGSAQIKKASLSVVSGRVTALIGPNGSGKTALVRALSRTLEPKSGTILLSGKNLYDDISARESALSIAVVPQMTEVFLDFTVREIVAMGRAPHRTTRSALAPDTLIDENAVDSALDTLKIDAELAARSISKVSGGERQRAIVARALAQESPILILDEPTASLDLRNAHSLLAELRKLAHERGKTVLVVLHDLNAAAEYADFLTLLSNGKIAAYGTPDDVLTEALIEEVYQVKVRIVPNPITGRPNVFVVPN